MILAEQITEAFRYGNYAEAGLWGIISLLAWQAARERGHHGAGVVLFCGFLCFGISDLVETTTGAWWRPWWLLAWKAGCLLVIISTIGWLWRSTRQPGSIPSDPPAEE